MARRRSRASSPKTASASRPRRERRSGGGGRILLIAVVVILGVLGLSRKGILVDKTELLANASADGVITQLLVDEKTGRKCVQASQVIDAPAGKVWDVVTDYAHYSEIFPQMQDAKVEKTSDGRRRFSATVSLKPIPISWKVSMKINHEKSDTVKLAEWDEPSDTGKITKGFWRVEDLGDGHTRLVHRIDSTVPMMPSFILRATVHARIGNAFSAVKARVEAKG